jgi:uncharacterized membrane protein
MGWSEFGAAFVVFFLSHAIPVRAPVRPWLEARLGQAGFTALYSTLSLAVLVWLIGAAGRAPYVALWNRAPWQAHVTLAVMLPVCLILALSIARPNPFSFGGGWNDRFDPARPGIVGWMRHPLLVALALWAGAHIVPNGDLAHAILFGTFAAFAGLGGRLIDRRKRREMGGDWDRLRKAARAAPVMVGSISLATVLRLAAGVILCAGLIGLHPHLFGVSPLP